MKTIIGVVHLPPTPGSYGWTLHQGVSIDNVIRRAVRDAKALEEGGVDAIIIENYGDKPYRIRVSALTVAVITRVTLEVIRETSVDVGISLLRNSAPEAASIALSAGASFIRSNQWCWTSDAPEGLLTPVAVETLSVMKEFGKKINVIADARVKHARPISDRALCDEVRDLGGRCNADVIAISGSSTGRPPAPRDVEEAKRCTDKPIYVASGITPENVHKFKEADGFIVGTYFKRNGVTEEEVDIEKVRKLVSLVRSL